MSTRKSGVNGLRAIYPVRQCPPLILLSLPLNYIMALIASHCRAMLSSNMRAAEQTSVPPCQCGEFNTDVGKKEDLPYMNSGREEWIAKNEKEKFKKKKDGRWSCGCVEAGKDLTFWFQIRYVAYLFTWPVRTGGLILCFLLSRCSKKDTEWMTLQRLIVILGGALRDLHSGKCVGVGGWRTADDDGKLHFYVFAGSI